MAFVDSIKNFYVYQTFQNMESAYKRGYTQAAANGLLNGDQKAWATTTAPVWAVGDDVVLQNLISDAITAMQADRVPLNAEMREFILNYTTYSIEDILKKFQKNSEKLESIIEYIAAISPNGMEIASAIYNGLNAVDYKNGKNKINPLYIDKKNIFGRAQEKVKKLSNNYLGKYLSKGQRDRMPNIARAIFDAITELNLKPTSGLKSVLENADKIKSKLPGVAASQFDDFVKALKPLSNTRQFKDALKSGKAMRDLIDNVNEYGADNNKVESVKTIHFLLHGLSYGLTSSSIRDDLKKNPLKIFSDPGLSWNKSNESLRFLSNATDKVLNFGLMTVFNLANMAKNKIRGARAEFTAGTDQIINIKSAQIYVADNPTIPLTNYQTAANKARKDYEDAVLKGEKGQSTKKRIMEQAEARLRAKELFDNRSSGVKKKDTTLDKRLELMAHWDFVHSGKTGELTFGSHSNSEKAYHNSTGADTYNAQFSNYFGNWNNGMAA